MTGYEITSMSTTPSPTKPEVKRVVKCNHPRTFKAILKFFDEHEMGNSQEIHAWLNTEGRLRHGCTIQRATNILSKMPDFEDTGDKAWINNGRSQYAVIVWRRVVWES